MELFDGVLGLVDPKISISVLLGVGLVFLVKELGRLILGEAMARIFRVKEIIDWVFSDEGQEALGALVGIVIVIVGLIFGARYVYISFSSWVDADEQVLENSNRIEEEKYIDTVQPFVDNKNICQAESEKELNQRILHEMESGYFENLNKLTELPSDHAKYLLCIKNGSFRLDSLRDIDIDALEAIRDNQHKYYQWSLNLSGLMDLTYEEAKVIAEMKRLSSLVLGERFISDKNMLLICTLDLKKLKFPNLLALSEDKCEYLAEGGPTYLLDLPKVEKISLNGLTYLSKLRCEYINLDGLSEMDDAMAEVFSTYKCSSLGLRGIEKISHYQYWKIMNQMGTKAQGGPGTGHQLQLHPEIIY